MKKQRDEQINIVEQQQQIINMAETKMKNLSEEKKQLKKVISSILEDVTLLSTLSKELIIDHDQKNVFENVLSSIQKSIDTTGIQHPSTPKNKNIPNFNERKKSSCESLEEMLFLPIPSIKPIQSSGSSVLLAPFTSRDRLHTSKDGYISSREKRRRGSDPSERVRVLAASNIDVSRFSKTTGMDTSVSDFKCFFFPFFNVFFRLFIGIKNLLNKLFIIIKF